MVEGEARRSKLARWVFLPFRWLYRIWFGFVFAFSLLVLYLPFKRLLAHEGNYDKAFGYMRSWARFLNYALLVPVRVERVAPLPPPPYVICLNHGSYLDIIHTYNVIPDGFRFMGKHELLRWPLFNIFFKGMNIAVDRGNRSSAARSLQQAGRVLDSGNCMALFPEGTIPLSAPRMKAFKDGAFRLAIEKQVPIVPVTFLDNWRLFGAPEDFFGRACPGRARVVVHAAVPTTGLTLADTGTLRHEVFDIIERPLLEP